MEGEAIFHGVKHSCQTRHLQVTWVSRQPENIIANLQKFHQQLGKRKEPTRGNPAPAPPPTSRAFRPPLRRRHKGWTLRATGATEPDGTAG